MTDLTKITTPFGLLDDVHGPGTADALRAHGGPYEFLSLYEGWEDCLDSLGPAWVPGTAYRVKPQPPKPREGWFYLNQMFETESAAQDFRAILAADNGQSYLDIPISRWREVLPEE